MEQLLQNLWANTTLDVVKKASSKAGARMYRKDWNLREDLHSWLLVQAQEFANKFEPDMRHPNPENHWAASLMTVLASTARWHWAVIHNKNDANMEAERNTIRISALMEDRDGRTMALPVTSKVTGTPELTPEAFYEKLEHLEETLQHLEGGPLPPKPETCIEWGCDVPALKSKPRCVYHNKLERSWHEAGQPCEVRDCTNSATNFRGLCHIHYQKLVHQGPMEKVYPTCTVEGCGKPLKRSRTGLCTSHYNQQYFASAACCAVEGCDALVKAKGLCAKHYKAAQPFKECSVENCTKRVATRGMCSMHYERVRKEEKANG